MHLVRPDTGHRRSVKISTPSKYPCRELESEAGFLIHVSLLSGRLRLNADPAGGACSNLPSDTTPKPRKPERISRCANVTSLGRRGNIPRPGPRKTPETGPGARTEPAAPIQLSSGITIRPARRQSQSRRSRLLLFCNEIRVSAELVRDGRIRSIPGHYR